MKITGFLSFLLLPLVPGVSFAHPGHEHREQPPWQEPSSWPDRVVATLSGDPTSEFSVSWRTDISVGVAIGEIVEASPVARFDLDAKTIKGETVQLALESIQGPEASIKVLENQGLQPVHYHSVRFSKLKEDTLYAYRVRGKRGQWTPWRQLRTAPEEGPVEFVFFGDAQTGIRSHITRTFDMASVVAPRAKFAIHGGDLVNTAMYDMEWAEWFEAIGRTHVMIPSIPVAGNHDYVNFDKHLDRGGEGKLFVANKAVSPMWRPQFELPVEEDLPEGLWETVYDIRYGKDLHIFVLDSSGIEWDRQVEWLERKLKESDARWKVLTMHHPLFSFIGGNEHPAHQERRLRILKTFKLGELDVVLTGHRHTYQRGVYGDDVARFSVGDAHEVQTVFVTTASSTKRGEGKVDGWSEYSEEQEGRFNLNRQADNIPIFAVFNIDGETLSYRAFDPVGNIYDAFTLVSGANGVNTIENGEAAQGPTLNRSNTGPYKSWDDLR